MDLRAIPAERRELAPIPLESTLQAALERLERGDVDMLYVTRPAAPGFAHILGVLTREDIERYYRL
jgi:hypothetical protein